MSSLSAWKPFLPRKAIVMARPCAPERATPEALEPTLSSPTPCNPLLAVAQELEGCTRCKLSQKRQNIVIGEGNPQARLVFVGEGPGEQEDLQGRPFVGKAGQLLDKMIEAMGLKRSDVMILNVVKCRPPGNRNPEPDEIESCSPFLYRQLDAINPEVIVALGKFAAQTLLQTEERISSLRGRFHQIPRKGPTEGAKLMPTFHPAFLLRNPESKREAWEDLKKVAEQLRLELPKPKG